MSLPPSSGRRNPKPLASKYVTTLPLCSPVGASPVASPVAAAGVAGRLVLSPTPCFTNWRSASDQFAGGLFSDGILRSGLRLRASSNNRFWLAFNESVLEILPLRRSGRDGLLLARALL